MATKQKLRQTTYAELTASTPPTILRSCHWLPESISSTMGKLDALRDNLAPPLITNCNITIRKVVYSKWIAQCCYTTTGNDREKLNQHTCRYHSITACIDAFTNRIITRRATQTNIFGHGGAESAMTRGWPKRPVTPGDSTPQPICWTTS